MLRFCSSPKRVQSKNDKLTGVEFDETAVDVYGRLTLTGQSYQLDTDVLFKAIGQTLETDHLGASRNRLTMEQGRLVVDDERKTSLEAIWAGGDCVVGREDLTVTAVQDGKLAAQSIHAFLTAS